MPLYIGIGTMQGKGLGQVRSGTVFEGEGGVAAQVDALDGVTHRSAVLLAEQPHGLGAQQVAGQAQTPQIAQLAEAAGDQRIQGWVGQAATRQRQALHLRKAPAELCAE